MPRLLLRLLLAGLVLGPLLSLTFVGSAAHDSTNQLVFQAVAGSPSPTATGGGLITFRGGEEPRSRWTIILRWASLQPHTDYRVLTEGRRGQDNTPEARHFSELCAFRTNASGQGQCWNYLLGLQRLTVVQVRQGNAEGPLVLQATRASGGPGTIVSTPNQHSPRP